MRPAQSVLLVATLSAFAYASAKKLRKQISESPELIERQRRSLVHQRGRYFNALVVDASDNALFYTYSIGGVQYTACQDVTSIRDRLPTDLSHLVGPATLKFMPNNPVNSILICEEWSGFRSNGITRKGA